MKTVIMKTRSELATKDDIARLEIKITGHFKTQNRFILALAAAAVAATTILTRLLA